MSKKKVVKEYTNDDLTVVWKPDVCIHSAICAKNLPGVFDPRKRPWVEMKGGSTEEITSVVDKCPSGALTYHMNKKEEPQTIEPAFEAKVVKGGPLLVQGDFELIDCDGTKTEREGRTAFCRCGASTNKPFCDGSHKKIEFDL